MLPLLILLCGISLGLGLEIRQGFPEHANCRFSHTFSPGDIKHDPTNFEASVFYWEGQFHKDGIGYRSSNGITIGHRSLGYTTGLSDSLLPSSTKSGPRNEAYHIMLLALAIKGNAQASTFIYSANPADAPFIAASILDNKLKTYTAFNNTFPGFAGFLPEFESNVTLVRPRSGWERKISAADNGMLLSAVWGLIHVLESSDRPPFQQLGQAWSNWFEHAFTFAKSVFMRGPVPGDICAIANFNRNAAPSAWDDNYYCEDKQCLNNDPFQGELMSWLIHFSSNMTQTERDLIWERKRPQLLASNYTGPIVDTLKVPLGTVNYTGRPVMGRHLTPITTQKGLYFGSDEHIKLLFLPYLDSLLVRRVFMNAERIRTCNSVLMGKNPGMFAATINGTATPNGITSGNSSTLYQSITNSGIPSVAIVQQQELDMVTPYSVFPTLLFDRKAGLLWYRNMLEGKQMQNIYGSTGALRRDGSSVARIVSWDSKAPTLLALIGQFVDIIRNVLVREQLYTEFMSVVEREYGAVFDNTKGAPQLMGEMVPICPPDTPVPGSTLIDFSTCNVEE